MTLSVIPNQSNYQRCMEVYDKRNDVQLSRVFLEDPCHAMVKITDFNASKDVENSVGTCISTETVTVATLADLSLHILKEHKPPLRLMLNTCQMYM
jgi:hypothetical protein